MPATHRRTCEFTIERTRFSVSHRGLFPHVARLLLLLLLFPRLRERRLPFPPLVRIFLFQLFRLLRLLHLLFFRGRCFSALALFLPLFSFFRSVLNLEWAAELRNRASRVLLFRVSNVQNIILAGEFTMLRTSMVI